jgi:hypothetical protein
VFQGVCRCACAWFVCDTCVSQVLIAVKCAVAGSLIATGV